MKILTADYLMMKSSELITGGAVCIDGDKIIDVGEKNSIIKSFPRATVENFSNSLIMPGFVNAHSHLELTLFRSLLDSSDADFKSWLINLVRYRRLLSEEELELSAIAGAIEGIKSGITCFADIGSFAGASLKALKLVGLRGIVFQETKFSPDSKNADTDFVELRERFLKLKNQESEIVRVGLSPHAPYTVSRKLFEKIADYAISNAISVAIHVAESKEENNLMIYGKGFDSFYKELKFEPPFKSSIEYLNEVGILHAKPLLIHCVHVSDHDIELISQRGCTIAHCPKSNSKFGHGRAPLEKFLRAGVTIGLGTDSVASNNLLDMLEEARFACFLVRPHEFIEAKKFIELLTIDGARALGFSEVGTIEKNRHADLIVIGLEDISVMPSYDITATLLFSCKSSSVRLNMVNGREIFRDGLVRIIDENSVKKEIIRIASKIKEAKA